MAVALLIGGAACGGDDDEIASTGDERARQAGDAAVDAGLEEEVADFLGLLARGETATYRVRFPGPSEGTELEITSRPPDRRVEITAGGRTVEVRLVTGGEAFACRPSSEEDGELACERTDTLVEPPGVFRAGALDELRTSLAARTEDYTFAIESQTVAGTDAECLVTRLRRGREAPERGASGTICASPEGAVLLVDQAGERVEATEYTADVAADAFERPDAPVGDEGAR